MNDRAPPNASPAQRTLRALLSAAYDDAARAAETVDRALALADRETLPEEASEVLTFAREYLFHVVADVLGARLAAALLHDLEEELVASRRATAQPPPPDDFSDAVPSSLPADVFMADELPRAAPTSITERPPIDFTFTPPPPPPSARSQTPRTVRVPTSPGLSAPPPPLTATAPPPAPAAPTPPPPPPARRREPRAAGGRPAVLLIDADRFGRAPLARALVRGGCDVTAVETIAEVNDALSGSEALHVIVVDADHLACESLLRSIVASKRDVAILARADRVAVANSKLLASGASDFALRPKSALPKELLELIARFASE